MTPIEKREGQPTFKGTAKYKKELALVRPNLQLLAEYQNATTKILHMCKRCKSEVMIAPTNAIRPGRNSTGCRNCRSGSTSKTRVATESSKYDTKLFNKLGDCVSRAGKYIHGTEPLVHICKVHGLKFSITPNVILQCSRCPCKKCQHDRRTAPKITTDEILNRLEDSGLSYSRVEYRETGWYATFICPEHKESPYTTGVSYAIRSKHRGCAKCSQAASGYKTKTTKIGRRILRVQGYEEHAIRWVMKNRNLKVSEIHTWMDNKVEVFQYKYKNIPRTYRPDLYIPSLDLFIEVKSYYTLIASPEVFKRNVLKAKSVVNAGRRFAMMVMSESGMRYDLPKDWYTMTFSRVKKLLSDGQLH